MEPSFNQFSYGFYPPFGFPRMPYRNRYRHYVHNDKYKKNEQITEPKSESKGNNDERSRFYNDSRNPIFELFGITLFFDDILLISLIFFLYNEGVQDQYLFIALILLLLS